MSASDNQIVVYQPNETVRLDVRLENETVWLTQSQMATLFGCSTDNVGLHLKNIYSCGELDKGATTEESSVVQVEASEVAAAVAKAYSDQTCSRSQFVTLNKGRGQNIKSAMFASRAR